MSQLVVTPYPEQPKPPATRTRRGNGKTAREKIARLENQQLVQQKELEAQAAAARAAFQAKIDERKARQQARITDLYDAQESKRAPQFQIDQRATLLGLGILGAIMFIATAVLTADGTIGSSVAARFVAPWMGFLLFGAFEIAILVFLLVYYVRGSRIDYEGKRIRATHWFVAMIVASFVTVAASAYHVLDVYDYDWTSTAMYVGIALRVTVAIGFVLVSKALATVMFAKAVQL